MYRAIGKTEICEKTCGIFRKNKYAFIVQDVLGGIYGQEPDVD